MMMERIYFAEEILKNDGGGKIHAESTAVYYCNTEKSSRRIETNMQEIFKFFIDEN